MSRVQICTLSMLLISSCLGIAEFHTANDVTENNFIKIKVTFYLFF